MPNQIFANDITVEIVQITVDESGLDSERVVGYMFASAGPGGSQDQRWVLYPEYSNEIGARLRLQMPEVEGHRYTSLTAFQSAVTGLWRRDSTYVKVTTESIAITGEAPAPSPLVAGELRRPAHIAALRARREVDRGAGRPSGPGALTTFPRRVPRQFQDLVSVDQGNGVTAFAIGTPLVLPYTGSSYLVNDEYWGLLPGYNVPVDVPAGSAPQELETNLTVIGGSTVAEFLTKMDAHPDWPLVSATCKYFETVPTDP